MVAHEALSWMWPLLMNFKHFLLQGANFGKRNVLLTVGSFKSVCPCSSSALEIEVPQAKVGAVNQLLTFLTFVSFWFNR